MSITETYTDEVLFKAFGIAWLSRKLVKHDKKTVIEKGILVESAACDRYGCKYAVELGLLSVSNAGEKNGSAYSYIYLTEGGIEFIENYTTLKAM